MSKTLTVARRWRGPSSSGNGGWTGGSLAESLPGAPAVRVRLSAPPPLDTPMTVLTEPATADHGRAATLYLADRIVARAVEVPRVDQEHHLCPPVPFDVALEAAGSFPGDTEHPFPECYVCGTARAAQDGLHLRTGPLPARPGLPRTATPWLPSAELDSGDGRVDLATTWAVLDCPGGWTVGFEGRYMVLGTMTATVLQRPRVAEPHVITGDLVQDQGRKALSSTALYDADGTLLARATGLWITVTTDPLSTGTATGRE
jgi:hypothetical protein